MKDMYDELVSNLRSMPEMPSMGPRKEGVILRKDTLVPQYLGYGVWEFCAQEIMPRGYITHFKTELESVRLRLLESLERDIRGNDLVPLHDAVPEVEKGHIAFSQWMSSRPKRVSSIVVTQRLRACSEIRDTIQRYIESMSDLSEADLMHSLRKMYTVLGHSRGSLSVVHVARASQSRVEDATLLDIIEFIAAGVGNELRARMRTRPSTDSALEYTPRQSSRRAESLTDDELSDFANELREEFDRLDDKNPTLQDVVDMHSLFSVLNQYRRYGKVRLRSEPEPELAPHEEPAITSQSTYERIEEQFRRLPDLINDQLAELENEILAEFDRLESDDPTPQIVGDMSVLADLLDAVRSEFEAREWEQATPAPDDEKPPRPPVGSDNPLPDRPDELDPSRK